MYKDIRNLSESEKENEIRKLKLKRFSFESDLHKAIRNKTDLELQVKDLKRKVARMNVELDDLVNQQKRNDKDISFYEEELRQIKRRMITLG